MVSLKVYDWVERRVLTTVECSGMTMAEKKEYYLVPMMVATMASN